MLIQFSERLVLRVLLGIILLHVLHLRTNSFLDAQPQSLGTDVAACVIDLARRFLHHKFIFLSPNSSLQTKMAEASILIDLESYTYAHALWCVSSLLLTTTPHVSQASLGTHLWNTFVCPQKVESTNSMHPDMDSFAALSFSCSLNPNSSNMRTYPMFCLACAQSLNQTCADVYTTYRLSPWQLSSTHYGLYHLHMSPQSCGELVSRLKPEQSILQQVQAQLHLNAMEDSSAEVIDPMHIFGVALAKRVIRTHADAMNIAAVILRYYLSPAVIHGYVWTIMTSNIAQPEPEQWAWQFCSQYLTLSKADPHLHVFTECAHGAGHAMYSLCASTECIIQHCNIGRHLSASRSYWFSQCLQAAYMQHWFDPVLNTVEIRDLVRYILAHDLFNLRKSASSAVASKKKQMSRQHLKNQAFEQSRFNSLNIHNLNRSENFI